jgi:short-subunit dehydrogenase
VHAGDITDPGTRSSLVELASMRFGGLDLLINNAGVGAYGPFRAAGRDRLRTVLEVNFFATVEMTRLAIPLLAQGNEPMIVNVGSILGHRGIPWASEYCASKFAVQGFSEALRAELSADGIDVLVVSPGTTETDFNASAVERADMPWGERRGVPASVVADATVRAIKRGKHEIVPNSAGRWLLWLSRLSPRLVDTFMQRYGTKR